MKVTGIAGSPIRNENLAPANELSHPARGGSCGTDTCQLEDAPLVNQTGQASVVVGGLVRQGNAVLLVKQQKRYDPELKWALPGGYVEHGESLFDALRREVREETGLNVLEIGPLLYAVHLVIPDAKASLVALVFQIETWCGQVQPSDFCGAEETILDAQLVPVEEAIQRLQQGYRFANEPAAEYLRGHSPPGAVWVYHGDPIRGDRLVECAPTGGM